MYVEWDECVAFANKQACCMGVLEGVAVLYRSKVLYGRLKTGTGVMLR